jgi:hypothetical protein
MGMRLTIVPNIHVVETLTKDHVISKNDNRRAYSKRKMQYAIYFTIFENKNRGRAVIASGA